MTHSSQGALQTVSDTQRTLLQTNPDSQYMLVQESPKEEEGSFSQDRQACMDQVNAGVYIDANTRLLLVIRT